jgi:SAM-dependent methyltransferase
MDTLEKAKVMYFHRQHLKSSQEPWQHVGWDTKEAQYKRYEALCAVGDLNGKVILDAGCGIGDLYSFLADKYTDFTYLGLDTLPEFIDTAKDRHGNQSNVYFFQSDFTTDGLPQVDYIMASGSLSYQTNDLLHPYSSIMKLYQVVRCGFAFNLLDDSQFTSTEWLKAYNKEEVLTFCNRLARKATLIAGYQKDDFTITMCK